MNSPGNEPSTDSREKWITIDRLCDAYEASLQDGSVERAPFLAGVPTEWREQLSSEFDAIDASYRDAKETTEDVPHAAKPHPPLDASELELDWSTNPHRLPNLSKLAAIVDSGKKAGWLGRFEVKERLGSGATGSVWRARDDRLDRWVALKVPHATRVMSDTTAARFKTEARAAAAISHPNVVQVHEVLIEDGLPILIQQWIDGPSLASSLKQSGPMDCDRAAEWMIQIADAVACAHDHGIVHRDLKPANVMLSNGRPMVLDFGLASYPEFSSGLTSEGTMLGTPAYMSPEQAEGKDSSEPTSDVYSLGAMLYEMLVGTPPFVGKTNDVLESVKNAMPVAPRARRSNIPRDLQTIALRCLAKSPKARYSSAAELRDDLRRFRERKPIRARKVTLLEQGIVWVRARPVAAMLWITLPLIIMFGAGYALTSVQRWELSDRNDDLEKQQRVESFRSQSLLAERNSLLLARASQELSHGDRRRGHQMLADIPAEQRGWEWQLLSAAADSPAIKVPAEVPGASLTALAYSPNRKSLYAGTSFGQVIEVSFGDASAPKLKLLNQWKVAVNGMTLSPNGRFLAWIDDRGTVAVYDLVKRSFSEKRGPFQPGYAIAFSPDGRWLAVGGGKASSSKTSSTRSWMMTFAVDEAGHLGVSKELFTNEQTQVSSLRFVSPDRLLVARGGRRIDVESVGAIEIWQVAQKTMQRMDTLWRGLNARGLDYHAGQGLVSWCDSVGVFYLYDLEKTRVVSRRRASVGELYQTRFSVDGRQLYCVGQEPEVSTWLIAVPHKPIKDRRKRIPTTRQSDLRGHLGSVRDIVSIPATKLKTGESWLGLITASDDGAIRVWLGNNQTNVSRIKFGRHVSSARWLNDSTIALASFADPKRDDEARFNRKLEGTDIVVDQRHVARSGPVAVCDGDRFLVCCREKVSVFDSQTDEPVSVFRLNASLKPTIRSAVSIDRDTIAVAATLPDAEEAGAVKSSLHLFRIGAKKPFRSIELENARPITAMALSPDETTIVAGTDTGNMLLIPVQSMLRGRRDPVRAKWRAHASMINDMVWLGQTRRLATVSSDGSLAIWSLDSDRLEASEEGTFEIKPDHAIQASRPMIRIESSPSGDRVVTAGEDRVIRVWDTEMGYELVSLPQRAEDVYSLDISPDEKHLMIAELHAVEVIRLKD
ncbi:MAG: WD40 repeat domain-containing serine/threonine protein kinase [Planctomycetota bacterium]